MNGIRATTGQRLAGIEHLRRSIRCILTMPIGTRVMRRDYGSRLFQLVDAQMNRAMLVADLRGDDQGAGALGGVHLGGEGAGGECGAGATYCPQARALAVRNRGGPGLPVLVH